MHLCRSISSLYVLSKMNNLIERLSKEPLFKEIELTPNLVIFGESSMVESLLFVQIISIAEEILEDSGIEADLFSMIFSSQPTLTLFDLQLIIDRELKVDE